MMFSPAWGQYVPPDVLGGEHQGSAILRSNMGQVFGTDGHVRDDVASYFEGIPLGIYLRDSSKISFTYHVLHPDSATPDTAYRVDMIMAKARAITPTMLVPAPGVANYYYGNSAVEQVAAYRRGVYENLYEEIDFHMYGSAGGPRMAFVVKPGGNPEDIRLEFNGQDSIGIDWQGSLKAYLGGKWVELKQAMAYQVANGGGIDVVPWTPYWEHQDGTVYARLLFGAYDHERPLVLQIGYGAMGGGGSADPRNMQWSTFIGGLGGDELTDVQVDAQGNPYACGSTWSPEFPENTGMSSFDPFLGQSLGWVSAVAMKFNKATKHLVWGTYYGGGTGFVEAQGKTDVRKLAVPPQGISPAGAGDYVFCTGTTNCSDFVPRAQEFSPFENSNPTGYVNGYRRMWVGAFKKENGICHWATTHGPLNSDIWAEDGLAIAIGPNGELAVGGRIFRDTYAPDEPLFDAVTPAGTWLQEGSANGFVMLFNEQFQVHWSTPFGGYVNTGSRFTGQVTNLCFTRSRGSMQLWLTGSTSGVGFPNTPPPGGTGYYQYAYDGTGIDAFLASFDVPTLQLEYATAWRSDGYGGTTIAYGLDYTGKDLWVVGGTRAMDLSDTECPPPNNPGPGVHHTVVNGGTDYLYQRCDGFILAFNPDNFHLDYGTLIGGEYYDMLLDVCHDDSYVYITGETRSRHVFGEGNSSPDWYHQPLNQNIITRDAVLLSIANDASNPTLRVNTAYGGTQSERGWAVAASADELFLAGSTASNSWHQFPLQDFDDNDDNDFYQDYNFGGDEMGFLMFYWFEHGLDYEVEHHGEMSAEALSQPHDGFITSFNTNYHVGIADPPLHMATLQVTPLPIIGQWSITFPQQGNWHLEAFNTAGQVVGRWDTSGNSMVINLGHQSPGIYLLRAEEGPGQVYLAKLLRP